MSGDDGRVGRYLLLLAFNEAWKIENLNVFERNANGEKDILDG